MSSDLMFGFQFWALMISCIFFQASQFASWALTRFSAFVSPFAAQQRSNSLEARNIIFFSKSSDLVLYCCKILRASLVCRHAQIHLPIGWLQSVICTSILIHKYSQISLKCFATLFASFIVATFAVGHIGISIKQWLIPIA